MKSFRCTFGPLHETDFVWPPPPADLEGRGVLLSSQAAPPSPDAVAAAVPTDTEPDAGQPPHAGLPDQAELPQAVALQSGMEAQNRFEAQRSSADQATEFVWPPPAADLEACSVVQLSEADDLADPAAGVTIEDFRLHANHPHLAEVDDDTPTAELELPPSVLARLRAGIPSAGETPDVDACSDALEPPPMPPAHLAPEPQPPSPLFSDEPEYDDDEVDEVNAPEDAREDDAPAPPYAFALPAAERSPEPPRSRGQGLMWAAVLVALSGLAIGYSEFRAGRREAMQVVRKTAAPPAAAKPSGPPAPAVTDDPPPTESAPELVAAPEPVPEAAARPRTTEPAHRREPEPEPEPAPQPRRGPEPTPAPRVLLRSASATPVRPVTPEPAPTPAASPAPASLPPPAPTPTVALDTPRTPIAEPVVHTAALESAGDAAMMAADEERIETTLTRFRAAYSKLDARAAREVWPSVDVEALDRAFRSLKSQDLRFDRCDLTVDGTRARAACRGSAVYVPRVGNQSPKATSREWMFELKKADQRWTIASARSS